MNIWGRFMAGLSAFREGFLHAQPSGLGHGAEHFDAWERFEARTLRYALGSAFWQNTAYRDFHAYARRYKGIMGLYRHTRNIYNPTYRLVEFQATHIMGGRLDRKAGDGVAKPSAIPIELEVENPAIRAMITRLWADSFFQQGKTRWCRTGSMLGDAPLYIEDDPIGDGRRGRCRIKPIHPGTVKWRDLDADGNVRAFIREERRYSPEALKLARNVMAGVDPCSNIPTAMYTEECTLEGDRVRFRTYKDYSPYGWGADPKLVEWYAPYPIVPLVWCQHIDIGAGFGVSEAHSSYPKIREADDTASKLNDQIRKLVEAPWFISGMKPEELKAANKAAAEACATQGDGGPEADRQSVITLCTKEPGAKAAAMVADLKIQETSLHIATILDEIERDHPDLRFDRIRAAGDASGTALREARRPAVDLIQERRVNYDAALVDAHKRAMAMSGAQGYEGFEGVSAESYFDGSLDHSIGDRTVFGNDPLDRIEEDNAEATATGLWVIAGVPLPIALERAGWSKPDIAAVVAEKAKEQAAAPLKVEPKQPPPAMGPDAGPNEVPTPASDES